MKDQINIVPSPERSEESPLSIDYWYGLATVADQDRYEELSSKLLERMKAENPSVVSSVMERQCFLKCLHCLFQKNERSSRGDSQKANLPAIIVNLIKQLPKEDEGYHKQPMFLHEGRILRKWHLEVLEQIRKERPDVAIGAIDNGSYTNLIDTFKEKGLTLDWIDISIDGTEKSHNQQRDPELKKAYEVAINGLKRAREIVKPKNEGGRVSSLFTLTNINYRDIFETANTLFKPNDETDGGFDYIDEFHITTLNPLQAEHVEIEISTDEMSVAWEQIKKIFALQQKQGREDVFFKIYRYQDLEKLAKVVGEKTFWESINDNKTLDTGIGYIRFYLEGVPIIYYPTSMAPLETIHIDADGVYRAGTSQKFTLEELQIGESRDGEDIKKYDFKKLDDQSSFQETYVNGVDMWWKYFGKQALDEEIAFMQRIKEKSS